MTAMLCVMQHIKNIIIRMRMEPYIYTNTILGMRKKLHISIYFDMLTLNLVIVCYDEAARKPDF